MNSAFQTSGDGCDARAGGRPFRRGERQAGIYGARRISRLLWGLGQKLRAATCGGQQRPSHPSRPVRGVG